MCWGRAIELVIGYAVAAVAIWFAVALLITGLADNSSPLWESGMVFHRNFEREIPPP